MVLFASDRVQLSFAADPGWKGRAGLNINNATFFVAIIIITIITAEFPVVYVGIYHGAHNSWVGWWGGWGG